MKKYLIFDTLLEVTNKNAFEATKILLTKLNIEVKSIQNTKNDIGFDSRYLNEKEYKAIFQSALSKAEDCSIIALENSSYLGLQEAKKDTNSNIEIILAIDLINEILNDIDFSSMIKHPFDNFNAGIYYGSDDINQSSLSSLLALTKAKEIKLNRAYKDCGYSIERIDKATAYKMAGNIMLDVFDTSCDFVIVNDLRSFEMFDSKQKKLESAVSREIGLSGLPVFSISQVILMSMGEFEDSQVSSNFIKATFL